MFARRRESKEIELNIKSFWPVGAPRLVRLVGFVGFVGFGI